MSWGDEHDIGTGIQPVHQHLNEPARGEVRSNKVLDHLQHAPPDAAISTAGSLASNTARQLSCKSETSPSHLNRKGRATPVEEDRMPTAG